MTNDEFVKEIRAVMESVVQRALGPGADQYDFGDVQRFEGLTIPELVQEFSEETFDSISYLVQILIRVRCLVAALEHRLSVDG